MPRKKTATCFKSQKQAVTLEVSQSPDLPQPSFSCTRLPSKERRTQVEEKRSRKNRMRKSREASLRDIITLQPVFLTLLYHNTPCSPTVCIPTSTIILSYLNLHLFLQFLGNEQKTSFSMSTLNSQKLNKTGVFLL